MIVTSAWRKGARVAAAGLLVMVSIGAAPVVAQDSSPAALPTGCQQGGTLTFARRGNATSFAPWLSTGNDNIFFQIQIYDRLVDLLPGSNELQPGLAESWDVSEDGLTYTFTLRDAQFSNGDPVTAEDVKFSLDHTIAGEPEYDWRFLFPNVDGFEIIDDHTVQMNMKQIDASILWSLATPGGAIFSKKAFETLGQEGFEQAPVGSGPFMFKSATLGQNVEVVRNPYYWRTGQPYLDGVNFLEIQDATARTVKIQAGEADIVEDIPFAQVDTIEALDGISVLVQPLMVNWYLTINHKLPQFQDLAVRQALNYATPKEIINDVALGGHGTLSNSMMVMRGAFWDDSIAPYPYDVAKAKELMAGSGFPDGFDVELLVINTVEDTAAAQILQSEWAQIGVNVTLTTVDGQTNQDRIQAGDYEASIAPPVYYTSDSFDDNEIASIFLAYSEQWRNWFTDWNDPHANDLVPQANGVLDSAARQALYSELQQYAMDQAPWVTLLNAPSTPAYKDTVLGFAVVPTGWWRLEDVCFAAS
jgi:peptide/nickel transport system substrate-binding protein